MKNYNFLILLFFIMGCSQKNFKFNIVSPVEEQNAQSNSAQYYNSRTSKPSLELQGNSYKPYNSKVPNEPGKCYAKCLIPDVYEDVEYEAYFYLGDNPNQKGIEFVREIIKPARTSWVRERASNDCLSKNPDDCLVWCLQETPEEYVEFYEVTDTTLVKDYVVDYLHVRELVKAGGYTEWNEVICEHDRSPDLTKQVQNALMARGYDLGFAKADNNMGPSTKAALVSFQKEKGLPVGQLDLKTLAELEIIY